MKFLDGSQNEMYSAPQGELEAINAIAQEVTRAMPPAISVARKEKIAPEILRTM